MNDMQYTEIIREINVENLVELKDNIEMIFLGYFKIKQLSYNKKHLPRYQQIIGEVSKVYLRKDIDDLILEVKGHKNDKSINGLYYLSDGAILGSISKQEYENHLPVMEYIYLVKVIHPDDTSKKVYQFKSTQSIKTNTKVMVDTALGKTEGIVVDCKKILKDQEKEFLELYNLKEFKKVLSVINEVEVIKKEIKEIKIEWK